MSEWKTIGHRGCLGPSLPLFVPVPPGGLAARSLARSVLLFLSSFVRERKSKRLSGAAWQSGVGQGGARWGSPPPRRASTESSAVRRGALRPTSSAFLRSGSRVCNPRSYSGGQCAAQLGTWYTATADTCTPAHPRRNRRSYHHPSLSNIAFCPCRTVHRIYWFTENACTIAALATLQGMMIGVDDSLYVPKLFWKIRPIFLGGRGGGSCSDFYHLWYGA